ncbi:MAG: cysteine desulfurase family protein [Deltaproteobacteria bacterium]
MNGARIYLDYNATTPVRPEVRDVVSPLLFGDVSDGAWGNASSVHWAGQSARKSLEGARAQIAARFERKPSEVLFTSGGSEADNLALFGVFDHDKFGCGHLVISSVEHPAVRAAASRLEARGVHVVTVGVDGQGRLDLDELTRAAEGAALVSVMAVNNETGVVLPTEEVVAIAHAAGALVHVDAVQAAGKVALPLTADLVSLSAHKLGGLKGIGALVVRESIPLRPAIVGGPQERGKRAGTEHVAAAVSLATAIEVAEATREAEMTRLASLRDRIDATVGDIEGARILGAGATRVGNTTTVVFEGVDGEAILQGLDLEGIATSSGSACSSGSLEPSHVLVAMGVPARVALSSVRFSLGFFTTEAEIDAVLAVLPQIVMRART